MLMDSAVIHDDHRIWYRIRIHVVQQASNKRIKCLCTKWTFNDITMDYPIMKRKRRQNRESQKEKQSQHKCYCPELQTYLLSSAHKESLTLCLGSTNRPRTTSICCSAIDRGLINEDKLLWSVLANPCNILEALLCRSLCWNTCELEGIWVDP
jgi:hypothetical protein